MLKALELFGFKSFADKTRFEFPAGITVVVGPNGSGKSNVVDAIKWVLGEQSAKSLRGQDMADVIFKGSGTSGRKPANAAEATIIFENSDRRLPVDAPEVHVTRRVYRGGEGEYLINRQPCRLKDIKDMFRGTGVGVDAYSIIEQGKVERLLQASPKDRRAMFEEAAGISRFKAKKVEAQRRLERVDQNLLRLNDIVEEVDARLRSIRAQASKAKRFREYSERLQQLRTQVGLTDWRKLTEKLTGLEREITTLRDEAAGIVAHVELVEARSLELETEIGAASEAVRESESRGMRCREQLIARESFVEQQRSRSQDAAEEAARLRQNLAVILNRAGDLQERLRELNGILEKAEIEHCLLVGRVSVQEKSLIDLSAALDRLRADVEARRAEYVGRMRSASSLSNDVSVCRSHLASLSEAAQRCRAKLDELEQSVVLVSTEQEQRLLQQQRLEIELTDKSRRLEESTRELAENRRVYARRQQEVIELMGRLSGAKERASLLEELSARREGVGTGAKELLEFAKREAGPAANEVRGMVAELIQAEFAMAPMVDAALGEAAQFVVVEGGKLIEQIGNGTYRPSGRVGIVRLDEPLATADRERMNVDLELQPGVLGRADRALEADLSLQNLVLRLLGGTWFVEDLDTAFQLQQTVGRGLRYVTSNGQRLEPDGTLIAGPRVVAEGLVSRRSELRDLRQRIAVLEWQIAEGQREIQRLQENIESQDRDLRQLTDEHKAIGAALAEQQTALDALRRRQVEMAEQRRSIEAEWQSTLGQQVTVERQLNDATAAMAATEQSIAKLELEIQQGERSLEESDRQRQDRIREITAAKVEMAKSEQRLESLRAQVTQFEHDQRERSRALQEAHKQLAQCLERQTQCDRAILAATSELAELFLFRERFARETVERFEQRETLTARRVGVAEELQTLRRKVRSLEEQQHSLELSAGKVQHERGALVERLKEDYGIDIAAHQAPETGEALLQREQVEEEIATLRKKINTLGAVNMDALAELDDLESRFNSLSAQFQDLKQAKESLERIIQKINADSRRLFLETLEAIRVNFRTLYRRAFGGGSADIVLEAGVDVLEGGVEILATPPGKPSFSNSLLSGGEKALTAVALLLAIFQFRPSPFCVLDEVDAPFDEANVGRFIDVLKEFLAFTKFVIVTHSKKTMTAANTLYGVTMQESGVSKRVSVQFDDVTEDGHIRSEAVDRDRAA